MAPKRARFYTYGDDSRCQEIQKFIEDAGVLLSVRDIGKEPLSVTELNRLLPHCDWSHFLNPMSDSYSKNKLDERLPERRELLKLIADDHTLLRRPIVADNRLLTVGCDKGRIKQMLQIRPGETPQDNSGEIDGNRILAANDPSRGGGRQKGNKGGGRSQKRGGGGNRQRVAQGAGK